VCGYAKWHGIVFIENESLIAQKRKATLYLSKSINDHEHMNDRTSTILIIRGQKSIKPFTNPLKSTETATMEEEFEEGFTTAHDEARGAAVVVETGLAHPLVNAGELPRQRTVGKPRREKTLAHGGLGACAQISRGGAARAAGGERGGTAEGARDARVRRGWPEKG
jgi:hypothetical protein